MPTRIFIPKMYLHPKADECHRYKADNVIGVRGIELNNENVGIFKTLTPV